MATFRYTAIDNDGKQVRGSMDAPSPQAVRAALEDAHLEITDLQEASRNGTAAAAPGAPMDIVATAKTSFAFEGTDSSGIVRRGSIQADDKFDAFQKLKQGQRLFLTMLSPVGVTPQFRDHDLENWQKGMTPSVPQVQAAAMAEAKKVAKKPLGFTASESSGPPSQSPGTPSDGQRTTRAAYAPLHSTLRLYAGWLLAWYGLFVSLGYYASSRALPWDIPFVEAFFLSPLIFSFVLAIFLFLALGSLHKNLRGGFISALMTAMLGIVLFFVIRSVVG